MTSEQYSGKFSFCYQAMKAYFCGLIYVVCSEHVIIVAYYLDICGFVKLMLSVMKITKQKCNVPLYGM